MHCDEILASFESDRLERVLGKHIFIIRRMHMSTNAIGTACACTMELSRLDLLIYIYLLIPIRFMHRCS